MKQYKDYDLEDFLFDDDFRQWVGAGLPPQVTIWTDLITAYPDKRADLEQARDVIINWQSQSALSDAELNQEIARVLNSTKPVVAKPIHRLSSRSIWWQAAASITLLIGLGFGIWQLQSSSQPYTYANLVKTVGQPLNEIINPKQAALPVMLPDGSRITLAANSRISYVTRFNQDSVRQVFLTGEAFFEVTKNPKRPFLVYADGLITRVVGTSFTIKAGAKNVSVVVRSGLVAVYPMQEDRRQPSDSKRLMLTPNQQAIYSPQQNQLSRSIADNPIVIQSEDEANTKAVNFQFDETPIADVFARLEQTYGLSIIYDQTVMKNCLLTVTLKDEPFFTKLDVICQTIGASYTISNSQIRITSKGCE